LTFENISDVFNLLKWVVYDAPISAEQIAVADLDEDGDVDAADALLALKYVINLQ
jgi:hypothetical protein